MNVVGRVGSLISQGVYSVATPFHPFGGAVDIIVVEQQDGTYRSTPWYVRFGKFQGVLKGAEKIVTIAVDGVEANFHMYLDNSGEAYFMREVTEDSKYEESSDQVLKESNPHESSQGDKVGYKEGNHQDIRDESKGETGIGKYEFQNEQSSNENANGSHEYDTYDYGSLEEVDNLVKSSENVDSEMVLVSVDGHILTAPILSSEQNTDNLQLTTPQFHLGPGEGSGEDFCASGATWEFGDLDVSEHCETETSGEVSVFDEDVHKTVNDNMGSSWEDMVGMRKEDTFKSCLDLMTHIEEGDPQAEGFLTVRSDAEDEPGLSVDACRVSNIRIEGIMVSNNPHSANGPSLPSTDFPCNGELQSVSIGIEVTESIVSVDLGQNVGQLGADISLVNSERPCVDGSQAMNIEIEASERKALNSENMDHAVSCDSSVRSVNDDPDNKDTDVPGASAVAECSESGCPTSKSVISGLGIEISLCGNLLRPGMGRKSAEEAFDTHRISEEEFKASGATIVKNGSLIVRFKEKYFSWDKAAHVILGMAVYGLDFSLELKDAIPVEQEDVVKAREDAHGISPTASRRWRLWPIAFRRTRPLQHNNSSSSNEDLFVDSESGWPSPHAEQAPSDNTNQSPCKQFLRTKIPTNEQIASLNLKDGQNLITFSFSTRVLGTQQVDAHIYLWKWNARIVISDVDGTITKSDVLGQFMPLVGKDWTQSGVARLFSAIKENGYQLLFLSARAIVQAYLTRSFLLNLKQDGDALPNGPIVISPDGLFPSLYREVIRRAPHEFKIACLEDIRALFPSDYNPFYAGFGNRDTDELSYRKIGIPKGKIFIINPKGEVAVNHRIDVKSYTSLHTLVNDMFPPTSLVEQEDYNSWNYWKMPLPNIDC